MAKIKFAPATKSNWPQLTELFGERGACAGCWCMWWRLKRSEWNAGKGEANKKRLWKLIETGAKPGILAFDGKRAIGWCSLGPREQFSGLERSRTLKPIDDQPVWSVVCLFVDKDYRRQGVATALLDAAAEFARKNGAKIIEGYPVIPRKGEMPDVFAFTGLLSAFEQAGYEVVKRPSASRAIVRRTL